MEAGSRARGLGFDRLHLTVRPGAHQEQVPRALPSGEGTGREIGVDMPTITTALTSAADPHAEAIDVLWLARLVRSLNPDPEPRFRSRRSAAHFSRRSHQQPRERVHAFGQLRMRARESVKPQYAVPPRVPG